MAKITINGTVFEVSDNSSIVVDGDTITVNNSVLSSGLKGNVRVQWEGPLATLISKGAVEVKGNVSGDIDAGGSVTCGDVNGDVDAGGSVTCGNVGGNIDAGGSVSMKK